MSYFTQVQILDDAGNVISTTNPLSVDLIPLVSVLNSSSSLLGAGGVFTGTAEETNGYGIAYVNVYSDVASATNGLDVQQSCNGTNWDHHDYYTIPAATGKEFSFNLYAKYFRIVYTNGATPQGAFRLQTIFKHNGKSSSHRINDAIIGEDDAELVKAVITGKNPSGNFVNYQATAAGNFKNSLEELENSISVNSNTQLRVTPFHADGTEGTLISGTNYVAGKSGIDASTEGQITVMYEHHEVHDGNHFCIEDVADILINNVFDVQVTTPDTTKQAHFTFELNCEAETEWYIYEGATINLAGTAMTPMNNNRNSTNASVLTMASILNTNVTNANADTSVAGATEYAHGIVGAGRNGGLITRNNEIILKRNTIYCMRAIANQAGYTNFRMCWYEHTPKN